MKLNILSVRWEMRVRQEGAVAVIALGPQVIEQLPM